MGDGFGPYYKGSGDKVQKPGTGRDEVFFSKPPPPKYINNYIYNNYLYLTSFCIMNTEKTKIGNYRWYISTLLFIATTMYYFDRQVFPFVINSDNKDYARFLGFLTADGKVDNVLYGYIDSAHKIAYALGFLLMGRFIDKVGLKKGFAIGAGVWSMALIAFVFLNSFWPLFIGMLALGFFQASDHPSSVKTVSEWFPARDRSLAVGFYNSGTNFGAIVVAILVPLICMSLGWKMAYIIPGLIGLVWVVAWWYSYDKPENHKKLSQSEKDYITEGRVVKKEVKLSWSKMFKIKPAWGFAFAKFLIDPVWFIYLSWLPKILKENFGVDDRQKAILIPVIYALSIVGNFAGGGLSTYLLRRGVQINKARKYSMLLFALLAVPSFISAYVTNVWIVVAFVGLVTFAHQAFSTLLFTTVADVFPNNVVGSVTGFGSLFGAIGGIIATLTVGYIANTFGYAPIFFYGMCAYVLALGILHLANPKLKQVELT
jgi:MFS transporter, ACS family, hexuronate transporter